MTNQEYLEMLVRAAHDGTFPSLNETRRECRYRNQEGKRCAIGLIIPDEVYAPAWEGETVHGLPQILRTLLKILLPDMTADELQSVQLLHDQHAMGKEGWNTEQFITDLRQLPCFRKEHDDAA